MVHSWRKDFSKNRIKVVVLLALIAVGICFFIFRPKKVVFPNNISLFIGNQGYYLEVAQTDETRTKGLSQRDNLCFNCGMFFVFDKEEEHSFWMKDTHIPLDIVWLNSQNQIVKIITAIKTDSEDTYINSKPAKYAIEFNANEALKLDLKVGDTIQFPNF